MKRGAQTGNVRQYPAITFLRAITEEQLVHQKLISASNEDRGTMGGNFCLQLPLTRGAPGDSRFLWFPFSAYDVLPWRDALVQLRTVCISVERKRGILQLSSAWSRWIKVLQHTLLLVKPPRGYPFYNGRYACFLPPLLVPSSYSCNERLRSPLTSSNLSLGSSVFGWIMSMWKNLESSFCFLLFSWCYGEVHGELVAQNMAVLL